MIKAKETKSIIRARIDELERIQAPSIRILKRIESLKKSLATADEDLNISIIESHKAICKVKQMGEKEAYGNDPAVYYTLGVCGEAGEMANGITKAKRNGYDKKRILDAVKSELPDVVIYSYILAHTLDINLNSLVNDKVKIVIKRAMEGYYGGPLKIKPKRTK